MVEEDGFEASVTLEGVRLSCEDRSRMPTEATRRTEQPADQVLIDLALQGGGAHGAFTWGVLDRLLEEPRLRIDGISGTSAGALNAVVLVDGHVQGGPEGARTALEALWTNVSRAARFSPFQRSPLDVLLGRWTLDYSPVFLAMDMMARVFSPYDLNPGGGQSTSRDPRRKRQFRAALTELDPTFRDRDQCPHRPRPRLPERGDHARCAPRLGLSAHDVSGGRDRRR